MDLPSGTIIFLCTDIEGSTKLWKEQPDPMEISPARHDAQLRYENRKEIYGKR